jgi:DNA polymerase III delta subunit
MELTYTQIAAKGFPTPIQRVYLLHGSDDALKREALTRLTSPLLDPSFADFDRDAREVPPSGAGDSGTTERWATQILASACGVPMASERRVVIVEGIQRLSKDDQDALAVGLETLGSLSCLVLVAGAPEYEAGKVKGRTAVGTKLLNAAAKHGATVLCDAPAEGDLRARANALAQVRGKTLDPKALDLVLKHAAAVASDRGGGAKTGDVTAMTNELEKLMAHAGARAKVTAEDARAVGLHDAQENIFALCDAVGRRDPQRALAEADELLAADSKPDAVAARTFVMLARHLRMLWGAKFLDERRVNAQNARTLPPDVQAVLSGEVLGLTQRQSYRLRDLQEQARGWSYPALSTALARVLASDLAMKGIRMPDILGASAPTDDPASNLRLLSVEISRTPS